MKIMGAEWKSLTEDGKSKYEAISEEQKVIYLEAMKKFEEEHPEAIKPKKEKSNKPRSAYLIYCFYRRVTLIQENPGLSPTDIMKKLGKEWKVISSKKGDEYNKYHSLAQKEKESNSRIEFVVEEEDGGKDEIEHIEEPKEKKETKEKKGKKVQKEKKPKESEKKKEK